MTGKTGRKTNETDPLLCSVDCAYWPDLAEIWPLEQYDRLESLSRPSTARDAALATKMLWFLLAAKLPP